MSCLNSLMNDMFDKIATEASKLSRISKVACSCNIIARMDKAHCCLKKSN